MEHVEVAGLRVGFQRAGSGPPLVLLHGGTVALDANRTILCRHATSIRCANPAT